MVDILIDWVEAGHAPDSTEAKRIIYGDDLHLASDSKILLISTEGDTDTHAYRVIVWS